MSTAKVTIQASAEPSKARALLNPSTLASLGISDSSEAWVLVKENIPLRAESSRSVAKDVVTVPASVLKSCRINPGDKVTISFLPPMAVSQITSAVVEVNRYTGSRKEMKQSELLEMFMGAFEGSLISMSVPLSTSYFTMSVRKLKTKENPDIAEYGLCTRESELTFKLASVDPLNILRDDDLNVALNGELCFERLGIGGMQRQEGTFRRRVIGTRQIPVSVLNELGVKHIRGVLLHGPPGTGKTLIARKLAATLNSREPKIVNGPELLNMFVGETERALRELFKDAEEEQRMHGDFSKLHVLIFDEIDALCKVRGSTNSGVHDNVVNQFLSKLDGVNSLNNLLVIGMTNRLDLIDPAVLRPGRLELHIEVGLPDAQGRQQILNIHTSVMRYFNRLAPDVNLKEISARCTNFTGAECESLVQAACAFAIERGDSVTAQDFEAALGEVHPAHGRDDSIESVLPPLTKKSAATYTRFLSMVNNLHGAPIRQLNLLLTGVEGTGKTNLALAVARDSHFPCVKVINPERLVRLAGYGKVDYITQTFEEATKSQQSVVVIDDLEGIIDYVSWGSHYNSSVLQALKVKLSDSVPAGRLLVVIVTSTSPSLLQQLGIYKKFDYTEELHPLSAQRDREEILEIMRRNELPPNKVETLLRQYSEISIKELLWQCTQT